MMNEKVLIEARKLISGFLKNRREELNISQQQLADMSGMGIATIKRFESGRFWLNLKQYLLLCHYLRCYPFLSEMEGKDEFAKIMRERWKRPADEN
jgi:transcriptional regulator with XRE-family HTH domain